MVADEETKDYLNIAGLATYGRLVQELIFGAEHPIVQTAHAVTAQTPGGTGALHVAADFIARVKPGVSVWVSDPPGPTTPASLRLPGWR